MDASCKPYNYKQMATTIYQLNETDLENVMQRMFKGMLTEATKIAEVKAKDMLITPEQAADTLKVSKVTLWRWEKSGYLIPISIGGKKRYRNSDIAKIIEKGE